MFAKRKILSSIVYQYYEDAIWPELSCPARFRILGESPKRNTAGVAGRDSTRER